MRKVLALLLATSLLGLSPAYATAIKAGAKCNNHKVSITVKGVKYTCIKSGNKLVWGKGFPIKKAATLKEGVCPRKSVADKESGIAQVRANTLIGMNEFQAEECAKNLGWGFRVGQRDEEYFALTMDYQIDRVTVTVKQGFVIRIDVG